MSSIAALCCVRDSNLRSTTPVFIINILVNGAKTIPNQCIKLALSQRCFWLFLSAIFLGIYSAKMDRSIPMRIKEMIHLAQIGRTVMPKKCHNNNDVVINALTINA